MSICVRQEDHRPIYKVNYVSQSCLFNSDLHLHYALQRTSSNDSLYNRVASFINAFIDRPVLKNGLNSLFNSSRFSSELMYINFFHHGNLAFEMILAASYRSRSAKNNNYTNFRFFSDTFFHHFFFTLCSALLFAC